MNLCQLYIRFVHNHYHSAHVVFDGYSSAPSTKDETHQRRTGNEMGVNVNFTPEMLLTMKKKPFLTYTRNKQKFIYLLGSEMEKEDDIRVTHSSADADYNIAMAACRSTVTVPAVVVV